MYFLEEVVLPPGEKIRRIRGYLGLKQYEITGGKVTRNLISYIENGKTKLVKDTAEIIVYCMNKWAEEKKMSLNINVEYLMRDEITQSRIVLENHLKNLKKYINSQNGEFENELKEADYILKDWDIVDKKAEIYEIVGDYYHYREQFNESHINYLKSLESYIRISNHLKTALIYVKLGRCAIWCKNYEEAINLNNYASLILENENISDKWMEKRILFNNSLAYKKLGIYDKALLLLKRIENKMGHSLSESQYLDILRLKANCYFENHNYSISEKIYKEIIDRATISNNVEFLALVYMNLSELYLVLKKEEKSIECINNSLKIRLNTNWEYLEEIYIELGKRYRDIYKYDLSEKYLLKALHESKKKNKFHLQIDIYKELLKSYIHWKKDSSIDELINSVKNIINDEDSDLNEAKEIFFRSGYYYIEKDMNKSKDLIRFGLNIVD